MKTETELANAINEKVLEALGGQGAIPKAETEEEVNNLMNTVMVALAMVAGRHLATYTLTMTARFQKDPETLGRAGAAALNKLVEEQLADEINAFVEQVKRNRAN